MNENRYKIISCLFLIIIVSLISTIIDIKNENDELLTQKKAVSSQLAETKIELQYFKDLQLDNYDYASMIYDVDKDLLKAIERHETGNYTSNKYKQQNNTWGAYDGYNYMTFDNHAQSTLELARSLNKYYFKQGLTTIEEIASKFCPSDEQGWIDDVTLIYQSIKKVN